MTVPAAAASPFLERIGVSHPLFLAPMEGVTGGAFLRAIATIPGVGCVETEFIRISRAMEPGPGLRRAVRRRLGRYRVAGVPLSVQLLGSEEAALAESARTVVDAGAALVDMNFGCPSKTVNGHCAGAFLLREPRRIEALVSAVRSAMPASVPLSAKVRAGYESDAPLADIGRAVEAGGADFVILHARTRDDAYARPAVWNRIAKLKSIVTIPVVGNGDVRTFKDAERMVRETGCDAVMVGRGAVRNPWIFRQALERRRGIERPAEPGVRDVTRFLEGLLDAFLAGAAHQKAVVGPLKFVGRQMLGIVAGAPFAIAALLKASSPDGIRALLRRVEEEPGAFVSTSPRPS